MGSEPPFAPSPSGPLHQAASDVSSELKLADAAPRSNWSYAQKPAVGKLKIAGKTGGNQSFAGRTDRSPEFPKSDIRARETKNGLSTNSPSLGIIVYGSLATFRITQGLWRILINGRSAK